MPPHTMCQDLKAQIPILHTKFGYPVKEICKLFGIQKSLVYKTLYYHSLFSISHNPYARQQFGP